MNTPQNPPRICTAIIVKRPQRKLIYFPSRQATDYMSLCAEIGCDWEKTLNAIPGAFDTAAVVTWPVQALGADQHGCAAGIEVPLDYAGPLPSGAAVTVLAAGEMVFFQSEPFAREEEYGAALGEVFRACERFDPQTYGYVYDQAAAPSFNFGASAAKGARIAIAVRPKRPTDVGAPPPPTANRMSPAQSAVTSPTASSPAIPPPLQPHPQGDATGGVIPYKNPKALIAYYCGVFSVIPCLGLIVALVAVPLGIMGLREKKKNPIIRGTVHAWIGIILGSLSILVHLLLLAMPLIAAMTAKSH